jgi:hypothetical protein
MIKQKQLIKTEQKQMKVKQQITSNRELVTNMIKQIH